MSELMNKYWWHRSVSGRGHERKRALMRKATANAANRRSVGGQVKTGGNAPRPITLPKLP